MTPERISLNEGVSLNIIPNDKFKTNYISVRFLCPMDKSTVSENALLPYVLKRGTMRLPTMTDVNKECQMLYGSDIDAFVGKTADTQCFGFVSYPLRDRYTEGLNVTEKVLELMAEMLFSPLTVDGKLSESYVEGEKKVLSDRVRAQINNKTRYAIRRCIEEMGKDDPSSLPETGTLETIEKVSAESLTSALEKALSSYRIEIWCSGEFDREALIQAVSRLFASRSREASALLTVSPIKERSEAQRVTEDQPVKQGKLSLGFTTSLRSQDPEPWKYNMFLQVLSSSPVSKLFTNVREKLSLCYYCYALPDKPKGTLVVTSGIEVENAEIAEKAILQELENCKNGLITDEELEAARMSLITSVKSVYDDHGSIVHWYFSQQFSGRQIISPEEFAEGSMTVTVTDLAEIANTFKLHTIYFLNGTQKDNEGEEDGQ